MKTRRNSLILLLAALIWGTNFVFQTKGNAAGPYTFGCLRSILGCLVLLPVIALLDRVGITVRHPRTREDRKVLLLGGVLCGVCLGFTSIFQQLGLYLGATTGKAGFLTACYIVLVPILGVFFHRKCRWIIGLAVAVAAVGLYLLCGDGSRFSLQPEDILLLLCAVACAFHILVIDAFAPRVEVVRMSCIQFAVAALITAVPMVWLDMGHSAAGFSAWLGALKQPAVWGSVLYAGIMSSGVGYTLEAVGQQDVNPTVASLVMSLESVFATLAGWLLLGQRLFPRELCGCGLIFAAVVFSQVLPAVKPKRA